MLGQPVVEPEHLLLALPAPRETRDCSSLTAESVAATSTRRSSARRGWAMISCSARCRDCRATDQCLSERWTKPPSAGCSVPAASTSYSRSLRLGTRRSSAILDEVELRDVVALVDAMPGERRKPVSPERLKQWLLRAGMRSSAPQPGPVPPVFERYTAEAQRAVRAASETAALLEHHYVEPLHLLLGCLHVPESLAWRVLDAELRRQRHGDAWGGDGARADVWPQPRAPSDRDLRSSNTTHRGRRSTQLRLPAR